MCKQTENSAMSKITKLTYFIVLILLTTMTPMTYSLLQRLHYTLSISAALLNKIHHLKSALNGCKVTNNDLRLVICELRRDSTYCENITSANATISNELEATLFFNNMLLCFCLIIIVVAGVKIRSAKKSEKATAHELKEAQKSIKDLESKLETLAADTSIPKRANMNNSLSEQSQLDFKESDSQKVINMNNMGNFESTSPKRGFSFWFTHKTVKSGKLKPGELFLKFLEGMVPSSIEEFRSSTGSYILTPEIQKYCFLKVRKRSNASGKYVKPANSRYKGRIENYLPYRPFIQKLMADPELYWLIKYYHDEERCPLENFLSDKTNLSFQNGEKNLDSTQPSKLAKRSTKSA